MYNSGGMGGWQTVVASIIMKRSIFFGCTVRDDYTIWFNNGKWRDVKAAPRHKREREIVLCKTEVSNKKW